MIEPDDRDNHWLEIRKWPGLPAGAKLVANCLLEHLNRKKGTSYPGYETIMEETGLSRSAVIDGIKSLQSRQIITRTSRGGQKSYEYRFPALLEGYEKHTGPRAEQVPDPVQTGTEITHQRYGKDTPEVRKKYPNPSLNPYSNPPPLSPIDAVNADGGGGLTSSFGEEPTLAHDETRALWREFSATYPPNLADDDDEDVERFFLSMPFADQRSAARLLPEFLQGWKAEKLAGLKKPLSHRKTWLARRAWTKVEALARSPSPPVRAAVTIDTGDPRRDAILNAVAARLGAEVFGNWFVECRVASIEDAAVTLAWPRPLSRIWVEQHREAAVLAAVRSVEKGCQRVLMVDDETLSRRLARGPAVAIGRVPAPIPDRCSEAEVRSHDVFKDARNVEAEVIAILERQDGR